ncbi:MAG TPA: ABC transporter permease [Acidimicrobiales bacterium]|nr:ABC transporter permease [Acidimicrobiales bacterium]
MSTTLATTPPGTSASPVTRAPAPPARSGVRMLLSDTLVFARRNVEHIRQIPEKLLDVTLQPLMFVLLFAYVFGGAVDVGGSYREYIIGGILVQTIAFGMMGPGTSIATDLTEGVIDRFRTLPARRQAYLLGHFVAELAGMMLAAVVLLGTGLLVGWRTHAPFLDVVTALALLLLFASAMIWFGTWIGMLVRSPDAVMGIAFVAVFPLTFISSAFVPIDSMPNVLQWVASWNPVSAVVAAVRELFGNPSSPIVKDVWPMQHPVAAAWLYCLACLAISVPLALRRFRTRTAD